MDGKEGEQLLEVGLVGLGVWAGNEHVIQVNKGTADIPEYAIHEALEGLSGAL